MFANTPDLLALFPLPTLITNFFSLYVSLRLSAVFTLLNADALLLPALPMTALVVVVVSFTLFVS